MPNSHTIGFDQLKHLLAEVAKTDESDAAAFLEAMVAIVTSRLQKGEAVTIHGLGTFRVVGAQQGEIRRVAFQPDDKMREQVNAPFSSFEPVVIGEAIPTNVGNVADEAATEEPMQEEDPLPVMTAEVDVPENSEEHLPEVLADETPVTEPPAAQPEKPVKGESVGAMRRRVRRWAGLLGACCCVAVVILGAVWLLCYDGLNAFVSETDAPEAVLTTQGDGAPGDAKVADASVTVGSLVVRDSLQQLQDTVTRKETIAQTDSMTQPKPVPGTVAEPQPAVRLTAEDLAPRRMKNADGTMVQVKLEDGERLTIVALRHFGDKAFWSYIYEVNSDRLTAPNLVQAGMMLYLPDPQYYGIDASDERSLRRAKQLGARLQQ